MDMQFPNGQLRYVAGDGFTARAFLPVRGGILQAHGKFPGEKRLSFSFKVRQPMVEVCLASFIAAGIALPLLNVFAALTKELLAEQEWGQRRPNGPVAR
jgi:hypothetical protein